jgi:hypothetical protein
MMSSTRLGRKTGGIPGSSVVDGEDAAAATAAASVMTFAFLAGVGRRTGSNADRRIPTRTQPAYNPPQPAILKNPSDHPHRLLKKHHQRLQEGFPVLTPAVVFLQEHGKITSPTPVI